MYTNLPTSQGYIFRILQHLATKLCSFSNFDNFFPKISFVIPRLKFFLKRKSSIEEQMLPIHICKWLDFRVFSDKDVKIEGTSDSVGESADQ
jgi:hypothetical protein